MLRTTFGLLLSASLAAGGCVQYTPVELTAVPVNEEVRVGMTDEGALRLARRLGRIRDDVMASVAPRDGDSVAVTIWLGKDYPGTQFENVRETVVLPGDEVSSLSLRRLSVWRTAALSAGALVGSLILANQIFQIGDPNRPDDDDPDNPPSGVTFIRIPFRWRP